MNFKIPGIVIYLVLIAVSCALLLPGYFSTTMFLWDESRQANNALEMAITNNFLYPTYNFEPEFWNTKPHLLIIIQAIFIKLFGAGLLALRLPSFLATVALILVNFHFTRLHFPEKKWLAFLWPVIIPLSGFNTYHLARTADYDALLTLFTVISLWCYLSWYKFKTTKFAILTIVFFTLAWFIKSFAILLWFPGIFLHISLTGNLKNFFSKKVIITVISCSFLIVFYCIYRELLTPGYLRAIWENEGGGRYNSVIESHGGEWNYYYLKLYNEYLPVIFELFILLFLTGLFFARKHFSFVIGIFVILFIVLLSFSKTCLPWYAGPAIPLILISVLIFDYSIFTKKKIISVLVLLCVGTYIYFSFNRIKESELGGKWAPEKLHTDSYKYLNRAYKTGHFNKGSKNIWVNPGSGQHEAWFDKLYNAKHQKWNWHIHTDSLTTNDTVWFTYHPLYTEISNKYTVHFIDSPTSRFFAWKCVVVNKKDSMMLR